MDKTDRMIHRRPIHSAQKKQLPTKRSRYSSAVTDRHVRCELIETRSDSFQHIRYGYDSSGLKIVGAVYREEVGRRVPLDRAPVTHSFAVLNVFTRLYAVSPCPMQYACVRVDMRIFQMRNGTSDLFQSSTTTRKIE